MIFVSRNNAPFYSKVLATSIALSVFATFGIGSAAATTTATTTGINQSIQAAEFGSPVVEDAAVVEVTDASGATVGYSVSPEARAQLNELNLELLKQNRSAQMSAGTDDFFQVAQCVGAVSAFIALTVFPTARAAKVAVSLGRLVSKYGVQKTAQILTRTYKGSDINAQQIFTEFAKEAAGIGALSVCFNPI